MDVSFIIVNYNSTPWAISCIDAIQQYTKDITYEILVVDNASTDQLFPLLQTNFPTIYFQSLSTNCGFGAANNHAIAKAKGEFIFLLNPDTVLTNNAAKDFVNYLRNPAHQQVAICGAHLFNQSKHGTPSYGNFPSFWQSLASAGFYFAFRKYYYQHLDTGVVNYSNVIREVDYVSGAALFARKTVIEKLEGFDEQFFLYFEETDLCKRALMAGYSTVLLPTVRILHYEGVSTATAFNLFGFYHFYRSRRLYLKKHGGTLYPYFIAPFDVIHLLIKSINTKQNGSVWLRLKLFFGWLPAQYRSAK